MTTTASHTLLMLDLGRHKAFGAVIPWPLSP
jgi:hypothetical protein